MKKKKIALSLNALALYDKLHAFHAKKTSIHWTSELQVKLNWLYDQQAFINEYANILLACKSDGLSSLDCNESRL